VNCSYLAAGGIRTISENILDRFLNYDKLNLIVEVYPCTNRDILSRIDIVILLEFSFCMYSLNSAANGLRNMP
jgi:hypothetical protein